jgi:UDP-N-acetyl-D-mannosaminuronic acid dehydrogenase
MRFRRMEICNSEALAAAPGTVPRVSLPERDDKPPRGQPEIVVLGGCGRVGLPLAIAFAQRGRQVAIYDVDRGAVVAVAGGRMPFREDGGVAALEAVVADGRLTATDDAAIVASCETLVVVIGTPVDEHLNPDAEAVPRALRACEAFLRDGQLVVLRSTVFPGVTASVERRLAGLGLDVDVAFCPERIAEGHALNELFELPQIVGARSSRAAERASALFSALTKTIVATTPEEAELAKLFTNAWRYIKFAIANQFFVVANDYGLDYSRIRSAITLDYPRAADLPAAGLAAGPCLLKDTMQLAAFTNNSFVLGHAAMLVNEGLPLYIVSRLERRFDLSETTVGILGMAFKAESDDVRESLAYKLRRILRFRAHGVLATDPYVLSDPSLLPLDEVLARSDVVVIAAPHAPYRELALDVPVVDIWNARGTGTFV